MDDDRGSETAWRLWQGHMAVYKITGPQKSIQNVTKNALYCTEI